MLARWSAGSLAGLTALIPPVSRLPEAPLELEQCLNDYQVLNSGPEGVWTNSGHPWTWMQKKKITSLFSRTSNLKFSMSSNKREPPKLSWTQVLWVCYQQKPQTCSRQVSAAADTGSALPEIFCVYSSRFRKVFFLQSSYLVSYVVLEIVLCL